MTHKITLLTLLTLTIAHPAHAALREQIAAVHKAAADCQVAWDTITVARKIDWREASEKAQLYEFLALHGFKTLTEDPDAIHAMNGRKRTPLYLASVQCNITIARLLIARGAKVNTTDILGNTPLHIAALTGPVELADLLIAHGADIHAQDRSGGTPLLCAASSGRADIVALLLKHRAQVNHRSNSGATALYYAADRNLETVQELLKYRADVTAIENNDFRIPLHAAAYWGKADIVALLLTYGGCVYARDKSGQKPIDLAISRGHTAVAELLRAHEER